MSRRRPWWRGALAVCFIVAGANHFRLPELYLGMMPPWLPWPAGLNAIAGGAEMAGGLGLMAGVTRRLAGWGLIALLVAVFPANVHVALQGRMPGLAVAPLVLWLRLPLQAGLIAWVWWVALKRDGGSTEARETGAAEKGSRAVGAGPRC
jgi:uncharacterized membrane protein